MNVKRKPKTLAVAALIIGIAALHPASVFAQIPTPQLGDQLGEFLSTTARDEWMQAVIQEYPFYVIATDMPSLDALAASMQTVTMQSIVYVPKEDNGVMQLMVYLVKSPAVYHKV